MTLCAVETIVVADYFATVTVTLRVLIVMVLLFLVHIVIMSKL